MQNSMVKFLTTALSAGALVFGAQAAMAQGAGQPGGQQGGQQPAPQPQATPMEVDDEMVSNFVDAYTDVRDIHNEYASKLQDVQDPEEATDLQQEAQEKMQEAVTSNDITVEEYQRVAQQIGQDAELRSRVQSELESASTN